MKSGKCFTLAWLVTFPLSGCAPFEGYPDPAALPPNVVLGQVDKDLDKQLTAYEKADEAGRWQVRNNLIRRRMIITDVAYGQFEKDLYVQNLRGTVYTDWIGNILTVAGPATNNIPTRNALSGMSAVLASGKATYEADVLTKGTMPALISEMRAERTKVRDQIRQKSGLPPAQYDLYDALQDLNSYKVAGTLPSALAELTATATKNEQDAEKGSHQAQTVGVPEAAPPPSSGFASPAPVNDAALGTMSHPASPDVPSGGAH